MQIRMRAKIILRCCNMFYKRGEVMSDQFDHLKIIGFKVNKIWTRKKSAKNRLFGHLSFIAARVKCDMPAIPNVGGIFRRRHISGKLVTALCGGVAGNVFRSPQLRQGTSLLQCFTCDVTIWSKMAGRLFSPPAACTAATR